MKKTDRWKRERLDINREKRRVRRIIVLKRRQRIHTQHWIHASSIAPLEHCDALRRSVHRLSSPPTLDLRHNYRHSITFFQDLRKVTQTLRGHLYIDMTSCCHISPAAALLLVAELDRWREHSRNGRLSPVDTENWDPQVRRQLHQLGFFDLLGAKPEELEKLNHDSDTNVAYMKMCRGHASEGTAARELRLWLESCGIEISDTAALYDGLVEAMTNVEHHAYRRGRQSGNRKPTGRWWMTAVADPTANSFRVLFLDHGLGIPTTLPSKGYWNDIKGWLQGIGIGRADHATLIKAAIEAKRSRTGSSHRGNGLKEDIQGYIEDHNADGRLRIYSNYGCYEYHKRPGTSGKSKCRGLPKFLGGTFLEWTIHETAT